MCWCLISFACAIESSMSCVRWWFFFLVEPSLLGFFVFRCQLMLLFILLFSFSLAIYSVQRIIRGEMQFYPLKFINRTVQRTTTLHSNNKDQCSKWNFVLLLLLRYYSIFIIAELYERVLERERNKEREREREGTRRHKHGSQRSNTFIPNIPTVHIHRMNM